MSLSDEELQDKIQQNLDDGSLDGKAYRKIFDALQKEPYAVSSRFADKVVEKIEARQSLKKDYLWFGLGLLLFAAGTVVAAILSNLKIDFRALRVTEGYAGLAIFGVLFIVVLQIVDKRFIQRRSGF